MATSRMMIAPPNLQFFISDMEATDVPIQGVPLRILATRECISVPCQYNEEGETELVVGFIDEIHEDGPPAFDDEIETPSGILLFSDVELTELMKFETRRTQIRIRIWTDGLQFPERVVVGLGD